MKPFILWKKGEKPYYTLCTLNKVLKQNNFSPESQLYAHFMHIYKMFEIMKYCCHNSYDLEQLS